MDTIRHCQLTHIPMTLQQVGLQPMIFSLSINLLNIQKMVKAQGDILKCFVHNPKIYTKETKEKKRKELLMINQLIVAVNVVLLS